VVAHLYAAMRLGTPLHALRSSERGGHSERA
jgi:hypothetical protein